MLGVDGVLGVGGAEGTLVRVRGVAGMLSLVGTVLGWVLLGLSPVRLTLVKLGLLGLGLGVILWGRRWDVRLVMMGGAHVVLRDGLRAVGEGGVRAEHVGPGGERVASRPGLHVRRVTGRARVYLRARRRRRRVL